MLLKFRTKKAEVATPTEALVPLVVVVQRPVFKRKLSERVLGVATVILIPGFLLASSIPALATGVTAFGDDAKLDLAAPDSAPIDGQSLAVTGTAASEITRTAFTAETHAQVVARRAASARAGAYSVVGPRQAGDDYPWRSAGGSLSPLGYVTRQCTDFVAWRINRDHGTTNPFRYVWAYMTPNGGSASRWPSAWNSHGWKTSHTPVVGAVAYAGNHVAYVKAVSGGSVSIEEYNWNGSAAYHTRTVPASSFSLYLYPPP